MSAPNINQITSQFARMSDQQIQQYAAMHKNDPYTMSLALSEMNRRKETRSAQMGQQQQQPKVVDQAIAEMSQGLPEDSGIAQLPTGPMQYADGGIVAFAKGGEAIDGSELFNQALSEEGITDPMQIAFLGALHAQESSGKATSKDSSRGAKGPMQVMPDTFKDVAPDLNINNSLDNMRAGIRYGVKGFTAAGGDPVLAGAYYYGGPGGMNALAQGKVRVNPKDKTGKEPNTLEYGQSIASRMTALLPMGSAQAQKVPTFVPAQTNGLEGLIPTGGYPSAPASNQQPPGLFSRIGTDIFGMSDDSQRQFSNLMRAIGGATGASNFARIPSVLLKAEGIAALPTANNAAQVLGATAVPLRVQQAQAAQAAARAIAQNPNVSGPFQPAGLQAAAQAAAQATKAPGAVAQAATKVPGALAQVPGVSAQASRLPAVGNVQRGINTTRLLGGSSVIASDIASDIAPGKPYAPFEENFPAPEDLTKKEKEQVVDVAKDAMPEKKSKGFSGEDWLTLGLGLLGGESQYFLKNLGKAGKDVMVSRAENKKAERDAAKEQADIDYKMQQIAESKQLTPARAEQYKAFAEQLAGKNQITLDKGQNMAIAQAMAAYDKQNLSPAPGARDAHLRSIIAQQQAISAAQSGAAAAIPSQVNVDRPPLSTFQG